MSARISAADKSRPLAPRQGRQDPDAGMRGAVAGNAARILARAEAAGTVRAAAVLRPHEVLQLQRTIGNAGVGRVLAATPRMAHVRTRPASAPRALLQRTLTDKNVAGFYDLECVKQGSDEVYVGTVKDASANPGLPKQIVLKTGSGAEKEGGANAALSGVAGIDAVLGRGKDYFIREAYSEGDLYGDWGALAAHGDALLDQTINLAFRLLEKGVIDVDRGVVPSGGGTITMKNMVIAGKTANKPQVRFFDFEPRGTIDWGHLHYEDRDLYESWSRCYAKVLRHMADNLGMEEAKGEAAVTRLAEKGENKLKAHNADEVFRDEREEEQGGYVPPELPVMGGAANARAEPIDHDEQERRGKIAAKLFEAAERYYDKTNDQGMFDRVCAELDDWVRGRGPAPFKTMAAWKREVPK
jgi:hypothetical protein